MNWHPIGLPGCFGGHIEATNDHRGTFSKLFQKNSVDAIFPNFEPRELYITRSFKDVLRGMHFQLPPFSHGKVVTCLSGRVLDVLLDLRAGKDYARIISLELCANATNTVVIPIGCAHGFLALEENSMLAYTVETEYSPEHDAGIAWNSLDFEWPVSDPILSKRDMSHPKLFDFVPPQNWLKAKE